MTEEKAPYVFRPPAAPAPQSRRLHGGVFFFVAFAVVGLAGLITAALTWYLHPSPETKCTENCGPIVKALPSGGLAEPHVFTSSAAGYRVEYPNGWDLKDFNSSEAEFATSHGMLVDFAALRTSAPAAAIILDLTRRLNPIAFPDLKPIGTLRGAHSGTQEGTGTVFGGTLVPQSGGGTGIPIRLAVLVTKRGSLTMRIFALAAYDQQHDQVGDANEIDYALTEFRWPGE